MPNKYVYLSALAEIRDYLRELQSELENIKTGNPYDYQIPDGIRTNFNLVAKKLGADDNWCAS